MEIPAVRTMWNQGLANLLVHFHPAIPPSISLQEFFCWDVWDRDAINDGTVLCGTGVLHSYGSIRWCWLSTLALSMVIGLDFRYISTKDDLGLLLVSATTTADPPKGNCFTSCTKSERPRPRAWPVLPPSHAHVQEVSLRPVATCAAASCPGSVHFCSAESAALGGHVVVALGCVGVCSVLTCCAALHCSFWTLQLRRRMEALDVGGVGALVVDTGGGVHAPNVPDSANAPNSCEGLARARHL